MIFSFFLSWYIYRVLTRARACVMHRLNVLDARWPSSLVRSCPETRRRQHHPHSDGAGNNGARRRGRPKKTWHHQIKDDMTAVGVIEDVALDRNEWMRRTRPTPRR